VYAMKRVPAVTAVMCVWVACACGQGVAVVPPPIGPPTAALAAWDAFPVGQTPRPVVLVVNPSRTFGFGSNEDAKMAATCHKLTSSIAVSNVVPRAANVSWSIGTQAVYPAISAAAAFAAMTQYGSGSSQPACTSVQPLVVTAVHFLPYGFVTDRGQAEIDSWLFTLNGIDLVAYPAVASSALLNANLSRGSTNFGSTLSADALSLTVSFSGKESTGVCAADYRGVVAESKTAAAIALQEIPHQDSDQSNCQGISELRYVHVSLASPLGGRLLLDASGNLVPVCPTAKPDC
jgi:hypothetical protein